MTEKAGGAVIIAPEKHRPCDQCGLTKECRDVLDDGGSICFTCSTPYELDDYMCRLFDKPRAS